MPFDGSAVLFEVAERFGVRFVLMRGGATKVREIDVNPPPEARPETLDGMLASIERDVHRFHEPGGDAMRRMVLAPTTPTWSVHEHELPELARAARQDRHHACTAICPRRPTTSTFCREVHDCTPVEFVAKRVDRAGRVLRASRARLAAGGEDSRRHRDRHGALPAIELPARLRHRAGAGAVSRRADGCRSASTAPAPTRPPT